MTKTRILHDNTCFQRIARKSSPIEPAQDREGGRSSIPCKNNVNRKALQKTPKFWVEHFYADCQVKLVGCEILASRVIAAEIQFEAYYHYSISLIKMSISIYKQYCNLPMFSLNPLFEDFHKSRTRWFVYTPLLPCL